MDNSTSPIKSFLRKHSPMKSRNKPLPPAPFSRDESPTRQPLRHTDVNARPTSSNGPEKTKRRLASLFRSSDRSSELSKSTNSAHHAYSRSVPVAPIQRSSIDDQGLYEKTASPPSLRRLNAKVMSLEEQLRDAQRQLDAYSKNPIAAEIRSRNRSHTGRDRSSSAQGTYAEIDKKRRLVRERSSDRFEGVVESLLQGSQASPERPPNYSRPTVQHHSQQADSRNRRRASADVAAAYERFLQLQAEDNKRHHLDPEDDEIDFVGDYSDGDDRREGEDTPAHQKRKRSELRQSSWKAIQEYQAKEFLGRQWERQGTEGSKEKMYYEPRRAVSEQSERPAQRTKQHHDKALPASPKASSQSPSRHQRSASLTKNELPSEGKKAQTPQTMDASGGPPSPARRYATSPMKLLPVKEEFEWDEDIF